MDRDEYQQHRAVITDMINIADRAIKHQQPELGIAAATAANQLTQTLQHLLDTDLQKLGR